MDEVPPPAAGDDAKAAPPPPPIDDPRPGLKADAERPSRPPPRPPVRREASSGQTGAWIAWIILLVLIGAAVVAAWRWESEIIAAYPKAEKLYKLVGLGEPAPGEGLKVENVATERRSVGGKRELLVTGEVVSFAQRVVAVPMLKAVLTDAEGEEITSWLFSATASELGPGERASFEIVVRDVQKEGTGLAIRFSTDGPGEAGGTAE